LGLDGGEWSSSRSGLFISRERTAGIQWIGDLVSPIADMEGVSEKKSLYKRRVVKTPEKKGKF
jgi:hypothetical protein